MSKPLTPAQSHAESVEASIRNLPSEAGVLIAPDGSEIARRSGGTNTVTFPEDELRRGQGATYTHNHPGGTGPSVEDIELAAEFGFAELRVVTSDRLYRVWNLGAVTPTAVRPEYAPAFQRSIAEVTQDVQRNVVDRKDFRSEVLHRTWRRVAARLRFHYERIPP